jgi:hypothetical protein
MTNKHPLTVACVRCGWSRTGRTREMLAAQKKHVAAHAAESPEGRP